ncbi:MAG TPA: hypothetical protein VNH64_11675 [Parvularculaceae bacterium]|nr:hypothetical protein [Parvularculaceae bacterium]
MRRHSISAVAAITLAVMAAPGSAYASDSHVDFGVTAGALGVGPEASFRFNNWVRLRANATFLTISPSFSSSDINYDGRVKLKSGGVMLDVYPLGDGLYLSGGARINGNAADLMATPTIGVTINGVFYTPAEVGVLTTSAHTKDFAPQASIGYSQSLPGGVVIGVEAGAFFQGAPTIDPIQSSGGLVSLVDLEAERQSLQNDVHKYKVYPVLQLRLGYRF